MKRGQKTPPAAGGSIPREVFDRAREKLQGDYLGFVDGTATEEPKAFAARHAAAREALDHLAMLCALAGGAPAADATDATVDEVLQAARASIATENKT